MRGVGQAHGASKGASEMISRKSPTRTLRRRVLVVSACAAVAFAFASVRLVHAAVAFDAAAHERLIYRAEFPGEPVYFW